MKWKLLLCLIVSAISLNANSLSQAEKDLHILVDKIAGHYGFANTIKAIIHIESRNGNYPVNLQDPACGVTHININTYMKRHKVKDTPFNRNKACSDLINSPEWAILNALQELMFWQKIHCTTGECTKGQYANMIKSYNAGWKYKSKKAQEYFNKYKVVYKRLYATNNNKNSSKIAGLDKEIQQAMKFKKKGFKND